MQATKFLSLLLILCFISISCGKKTEESNACPDTNTTKPLLLGNWNFVGTFIDGVLELEPCDIDTELEVNERQFKYTSYFGTNCEMSAMDILCYSIENNIVSTNEESSSFVFEQEIMTLTNSSLVLKTVSQSGPVVTENWER